MNSYLIIILAALLVNYALNLIADLLNLKALEKPLPESFRSVYDEQKEAKTREYTRVKTRFGITGSTFSLVVLLFFWFAGGFNWLDIQVRDLNYGPITSGLVYIGLIMMAQQILGLPFSIYATFVIEERFGFNKTTPLTFVTDRLKGILLSVVLGLPLLGLVLGAFEYFGTVAWLYAWGVTILFSLFVQFVAPVWIMPLFNVFTLLEEGELKQAIMSYADKVSFSVKGIFTMDGSRRSNKSNAFFTGFGKNKRIVLFDTLVEKHTVDELVAILAHEVGHYRKKHIPKNMITGFLHSGFILFMLSLFIRVPGLHEAFFMDQVSVYAGLIFFGLLYSPIGTISSIAMQYISRRFEYQADHFASTTISDPESLVSALMKLAADNLSHLTPHPFYVFLNYSHPPVPDRIRAIRNRPATGSPNPAYHV